MPLSSEAFAFTKELCLQRDVEVTVETMDRAGNFVGWMFIDERGTDSSSTTTEHTKSSGKKKKKVATESNTSKSKINLSILLVSKGLATVLRTAATEISPYYHELIKAESAAKEARIGLWALDEFVKQWEADANAFNDAANANGAEDERLLPGGKAQEYLDDLSMLNLNGQVADSGEDNQALSKIQWKPVQVTALSKPTQTSQGLRFFIQYMSDSATIVQISHGLNGQHHPPPVPGYVPAKNDLCAACFSLDNCWYRARAVRKTTKNVTVQFIDFGNEETIEMTDAALRLSPLPSNALANIPPQAHEYRLGLVQLPPDSTDRAIAERLFTEQVENKEVLLGVLFDPIPCANETVKPVPGVALRVPSAVPGVSSSYSPKTDVAHNLLEDGLVCVEPMQSQLIKQLPHDLLRTYLDAQAQAKKGRKNIWRYGDFRIDDSQI
jgi:staphylococcal nuclease domain-containing protein 1